MSKAESGIPVKIYKVDGNQFSYQNVIFFHKLKGIDSECYVSIGKKTNVHLAKVLDYPNLKEDYLFMNQDDRVIYNLQLNEETTVKIVKKPKRLETVFVMMTDPGRTNQIIGKDIPSNLMERLHHKFDSTVANVDTDPYIFAGPNNSVYCRAKIVTLLNESNAEVANGIVDNKTEFVVLNLEKKASELNISSIDFQKVGVGGLTEEFQAIVQKILLTRLIPNDLFIKTGIQHTKGVILYGPPGCGKTMIARNIGKTIGCKNIIVVNGPELSSKYVGESEKNIRAQFEKAKTKPDELFILIFDEIDAIASKRTGSEQRHNDQVVNQLLTMMDGVEPIPNLIIFGMTNRLDMLDPAVLRPGRFDIHLEISLPNENGRYEILQIHSANQRKNGLFDKDVDLKAIATQTENFTGAELALLVNNTVSRVIDKQIDYNNIAESAKKIKTILIKQDDFIETIKGITPMFKTTEKVKEDLKKRIKKDFDQNDESSIKNNVDLLKNSSRPTIICINGRPKSGKTSLACSIASKLDYSNTQYVSPAILMKMTDKQKAEYITDIFENETKGLIILDNVETIIEFVSEHIFNKTIFHLLKVSMNETKHHIILTTPYYDRLASMTFMDYVDEVC